MKLEEYFVCPNGKCNYAIASDTQNELQLETLRRMAKICPECGKRNVFLEQTSLPNIQTKISTSYGGTNNENIKRTARQIRADERRAQNAKDWQA